MPLKVDTPPPPVDTPSGGGGGDRGWVELVRAENDIDAHLLAGRLNDAAIETRTVKDRAVPGAWLYGGSNPWAPVTIYVRRWQLLDARVVLAEVAYNSPDAEGSASAHDRPGWRIPLMWWATALALGVFFTVVALLQAASSMSFCQLPIFCSNRAPAEAPSER